MAILHSDERKAEIVARLRRVEGQVRGVAQMIQEEAELEKIAQQLAAGRKALDRAFHHLVASALREQLRGSTGVTAEVQRLTELLARFA